MHARPADTPAPRTHTPPTPPADTVRVTASRAHMRTGTSDTHLAEACEEPVHHRRLPVDGVSHAVPFGHPVTEQAQTLLDQEAGRSGPCATSMERLGASLPRTTLSSGRLPVSCPQRTAGDTAGGGPGRHVTCKAALGGLSFLPPSPGAALPQAGPPHPRLPRCSDTPLQHLLPSRPHSRSAPSSSPARPPRGRASQDLLVPSGPHPPLHLEERPRPTSGSALPQFLIGKWSNASCS